jgi:hypothetical protein
MHAREESVDSRAASLGLLEIGLTTREEEVHRCE